MASTHSLEHAPLHQAARPSAFPERRLARRIAVEGRDPAYFPPNRRPATDDDDGGVRGGTRFEGTSIRRESPGAVVTREIFTSRPPQVRYAV